MFAEVAQVASEHMPSELEGMTADEQETQRALWQAELTQVINLHIEITYYLEYYQVGDIHT